MKVSVYFCKEPDVQEGILRDDRLSRQALDTIYDLVWECEFKNILNVGRIWLKFKKFFTSFAAISVFSQPGPESVKLGSYLYPLARADEVKSINSTCSAGLKDVPIVASVTCCTVRSSFQTRTSSTSPVKKFPGGVTLELAPILTGFVPEDSGEEPNVDFVAT